MVAFYTDVVGLVVQSRRDESESESESVTLGVGETPLLVLTRDERASPRNRDQTGLFHTAFRVPSRAALGAALDRIREQSQLRGASDHYVSEALYLGDPEGNGVEIYWDRPREAWPRADDGTVEIGTIPLDVDDVAAASDESVDAPVGTTVGHVHLEVSSIAASRQFYVDTLGLRLQTEMPSALFVAAGDYHHHLGLNMWNGRSQPAEGRGLAWFEFLVDDAETLATVRRRLTDMDVSATDVADGFEVVDPDGITVRFRAE